PGSGRAAAGDSHERPVRKGRFGAAGRRPAAAVAGQAGSGSFRSKLSRCTPPPSPGDPRSLPLTVRSTLPPTPITSLIRFLAAHSSTSPLRSIPLNSVRPFSSWAFSHVVRLASTRTSTLVRGAAATGSPLSAGADVAGAGG